MTALPAFAALRHHTVREGFEVVFPRATADGFRFEGTSVGVEDGEPFVVRYAIDLDAAWRTRRAEVGDVVLECADGRWTVDGRPAPHLDGVIDVDLEASAVTNAFPVARGVGDAPAAWVRLDSSVERLEQSYRALGNGRFAYESPRFGFSATLTFDAAGIIVDYPGIATRVG